MTKEEKVLWATWMASTDIWEYAVDIILDFTPVMGYADDATAIGMALFLAQMYITEDIKAQARNRIHGMFGGEAVARLDEEEECNG